MNSVIVKTVVSLCVWASLSTAQASVITLPENELPSETVTPKLDNRTVVLNRTIKKDGRVSAGFALGSLLDEMFYNGTVLSLDLRYNTSEMGAWGLRYDQWTGGATSYTETFAAKASQLRFNLAPSRSSGVFVTRSIDTYYGKLSLGKEVVTPLHFSWLAMLGAQTYGSEWLPAVQGGAQVRLYLLKTAALDIQYLFSGYQKVDPTSADFINIPTPKASDFSKKFSFGQIVQVGFSYLF